MSNMPTVPREQLNELEPMLKAVEAAMGFLPNSMLTMAHWPDLVRAFGALGGTVLGGGEVDLGLKQLVAFVASTAAGCRYCQAHTAHTAERRGVSAAKLQAAFEYETSPLFSEPERAALRVAAHGGMVPNAVEANHLAELAKHFSARQVTEIVAVVALFGFLNRWNDTMATALEDAPKFFADTHLGPRGWSAGKHA